MRGMAERLSVPNPDHEVVEGMTWGVRVTLLTDAEFSEERVDRLNDGLRSTGVRCWIGWAYGENGAGVSATIVLDAGSPGAAADRALRLLGEVAAADGIDARVLSEVVVAPGWRDERDWSLRI